MNLLHQVMIVWKNAKRQDVIIEAQTSFLVFQANQKFFLQIV